MKESKYFLFFWLNWSKCIQNQKFIIFFSIYLPKGPFKYYVSMFLAFLGLPIYHYSRFGVFLSKNCMHVKTDQIELFAIEIVNSIHFSSLKKVLPKCKVSFPGHFLLCTNHAPRCPWIFFHEDLAQTQLDHWELVLGAKI